MKRWIDKLESVVNIVFSILFVLLMAGLIFTFFYLAIDGIIEEMNRK